MPLSFDQKFSLCLTTFTLCITTVTYLTDVRDSWDVWKILIFSFLLIVSIFSIIQSIRLLSPYYKTFKAKDDESALEVFKKYYRKQISVNKKILISSSDLSWIDNENDEVFKELVKKITKNDLYIIMPTRSSISQELEKSGAQITYYQSPVLSHRFTIFNWGNKNQYHILIGDGSNNNPTKHHIYKYDHTTPIGKALYELAESVKERNDYNGIHAIQNSANAE